MSQQLALPIQVITQEDGPGYLALCPTLPGCHAEGRTIGEAIDHLYDVIHTLLSVIQEDGISISQYVTNLPTPPMTGQVVVSMP